MNKHKIIIFYVCSFFKGNNMLIIEYCEDGGLFLPDSKVEEYINDFLKNKYKENENYILKVSNSIIITGFRVHIKRMTLNYKNVVFKYKDNLMYPDKDGRFEWVPGFCDVDENYLIELF